VHQVGNQYIVSCQMKIGLTYHKTSGQLWEKYAPGRRALFYDINFKFLQNMYHRISCEANNLLDSQEILRISWNLKTHYRVHGSQMNPAHVLVSYFFKSTLILLSRLRYLSSGLFPLGFLPKPYTHFAFPHTCHTLRPSHSPWFDQPNNIWRGMKLTKIIIMHYFPASSYFFHLAPVIFLRTLFWMPLVSNVLSCERPCFTSV